MSIDEARLNEFLGRAVGDLGAAISSTLMLVGDQLGYYRALADEPLDSHGLATRTDTHERYAREWLGNQAAGGYVQYDATSGQY
ncbi:MAG: SAM-dependent methyltransferase, partial [Proteobacteria bacterium]|nr:SAM-dependent methyltransferase [Pseudomonadota bacterium]